jgi:hypothetical protein
MIIVDDSLLPKDGAEGKQGKQGPPGIAGRDGRDGASGADGRSFNPRGTWVNHTEYARLDTVEFFGNSYVAREPNKGKYPPSYPRFWQLLAKKGDDGKDGETKVYKVGSPRLVSAMAEIEELKQQLQQSGTNAVPAVADSPLSKGTVVCSTGDENRVTAARADAMETSIALGLIAADVGADEDCLILPGGLITVDSWNLTPNTIYFLSPSVAGQITSVCPSNVGEYVVIVGTAVSSKSLLIEIHRAYIVG